MNQIMFCVGSWSEQYLTSPSRKSGLSPTSPVDVTFATAASVCGSIRPHRYLGALLLGRQVGAVDRGDAVGGEAAVALRPLAGGGGAVERLNLLGEAGDEVFVGRGRGPALLGADLLDHVDVAELILSRVVGRHRRVRVDVA